MEWDTRDRNLFFPLFRFFVTMNNFALRIIFLLLFGMNIHSPFAQEVLSPNAKVSLLTCEPGNHLYSLFGHSAIWVHDPDYQINEVFNYGTFDYNDPNFMVNFLKGKLIYWLAVDDGERFLYTYNYLKRGVRENVLELDFEQKITLYQSLVENAKPENRSYPYDFYHDNCSTRIGELMENLFGPYEISLEENKTFRDLLHEYLEGLDWTRFGMDLILGKGSDQLATSRQQMFLPDYLAENLLKATDQNGDQFLKSTVTIINHPWTENKSYWITPILLFTFLLLVEIVILRYKSSSKWVRFYDKVWMILMSLASLILLFMWFGTDHQSCSNNYNLLVFTPLIIVWLVAEWRKSKYLKWISLSVVLPFILLPFVKMGAQNIPSPVLLIALITLIKVMRTGGIKELRKWV